MVKKQKINPENIIDKQSGAPEMGAPETNEFAQSDDINSGDEQFFWEAASTGNAEFVEQYISLYDINAETIQEAINIAQQKKHYDVIRLLVNETTIDNKTLLAPFFNSAIVSANIGLLEELMSELEINLCGEIVDDVESLFLNLDLPPEKYAEVYEFFLETDLEEFDIYKDREKYSFGQNPAFEKFRKCFPNNLELFSTYEENIIDSTIEKGTHIIDFFTNKAPDYVTPQNSETLLSCLRGAYDKIKEAFIQRHIKVLIKNEEVKQILLYWTVISVDEKGNIDLENIHPLLLG